MQKILYVSHVNTDGQLSNIGKEALSTAVDLSKQLRVTLEVGLFGNNVTAALDSVSGAELSKIWVVQNDALQEPQYYSDALALETICKSSGADLIIVPSTSRTNRVVGGVCARLKGNIDTHVAKFVIDDSTQTVGVERWYYKQRMFAQNSRSSLTSNSPWIVTIDSGNYPAFSTSPQKVETSNLNISFDPSKLTTKTNGIKTPDTDKQTIKPDANLLFVAGAGWSKKQADGQTHVKQAEQIILDFLSKSSASLGSTKSLVDMSGEGADALSFMTHLNQVGQTGSTPRHPKGLATCCHGEEPHVIGWRFIGEARAISLDPNCGWAQGKADVLYVGDAFEIMAKVNELLS